VGGDSKVEPHGTDGAIYHYTDEAGEEKAVHFKTYIDCVGQPHLAYEEFPFKSLLKGRTISPAKLKFSSAEAGIKAINEGKPVSQDDNGDYYLRVSGITINDHFQAVDGYGAFNERIFIMAVPYIGGFNPDYSGLDFSEEASKSILQRMF
jgi:hypothetical protein